MLTFLGLQCRDAPLIILYFIVIGISIPKIRTIEYSSNDYSVATLSNYYRNHHAKLEIDRIILTKKAIRLGQTDVRTDPNYRKASLLKIYGE